MSQHRTQLLFEIRDCLDHLHIPTQILDVEITEVINQYLSPFWRGSSSKIDWQLLTMFKKLIFLTIFQLMHNSHSNFYIKQIFEYCNKRHPLFYIFQD
ncbi:hypothetical protein [Acinetobacter sp. CFCC 10889]|uniref:hypothetical protein n=1 Tax=Acinetobacter sp. CFCC 10889 TaxID=1775557 RepID=UPI0013A6AFD5|nr:hypothetical protein [Acinetobacter sp. CFCC 10889]